MCCGKFSKILIDSNYNYFVRNLFTDGKSSFPLTNKIRSMFIIPIILKINTSTAVGCLNSVVNVNFHNTVEFASYLFSVSYCVFCIFR